MNQAPLLRIVLRAAACAVILLAAHSAQADWVVLKDGTRYQCLITAETETSLTIDIKGEAGRQSLQIDRATVEQFVRWNLPKGFFGESSKTTEPDTRQDSPPKSQKPTPSTPLVKYVEIPLVGAFGEDFDETGVRHALETAQRQGIRHILFTLDSPGGGVDVARKIAEAMQSRRDQFKYCCRIKKAFSASMWIVVNCDRVFFDSASVAGAAVCYSEKAQTGAKEVDAKFNGAVAAQLAAYAEAKGRIPPLLVRAMVDAEVEVYAQKGPDGTELSASPPEAERSKWRLVDSKTQVLSLTASEAVDLGFGEMWDRRGDVFVDGWRLQSRIGAPAMEDSKRRCAEFKKAAEWYSRLSPFVKRARDARPARAFSDYTYEIHTWTDSYGIVRSREQRTAESEAMWSQRQRAYSAAWDTVRLGAEDLLKLMRKYDDSDRPEEWHARIEELSDSHRIAVEKMNEK